MAGGIDITAGWDVWDRKTKARNDGIPGSTAASISVLGRGPFLTWQCLSLSPPWTEFSACPSGKHGFKSKSLAVRVFLGFLHPLSGIEVFFCLEVIFSIPFFKIELFSISSWIPLKCLLQTFMVLINATCLRFPIDII